MAASKRPVRHFGGGRAEVRDRSPGPHEPPVRPGAGTRWTHPKRRRMGRRVGGLPGVQRPAAERRVRGWHRPRPGVEGMGRRSRYAGRIGHTNIHTSTIGHPLMPPLVRGPADERARRRAPNALNLGCCNPADAVPVQDANRFRSANRATSPTIGGSGLKAAGVDGPCPLSRNQPVTRRVLPSARVTV
jgi:hypothetical protein